MSPRTMGMALNMRGVPAGLPPLPPGQNYYPCKKIRLGGMESMGMMAGDVTSKLGGLGTDSVFLTVAQSGVQVYHVNQQAPYKTYKCVPVHQSAFAPPCLLANTD